VPLIVPCVSALLLQRAGANNPRVIAIAAPSEKGSVLTGRPALSVESCQPGVGGRNFLALADVKRRARSFTGDGDRGVSGRFARRDSFDDPEFGPDQLLDFESFGVKVVEWFSE
jgi:hypothetical protein